MNKKKALLLFQIGTLLFFAGYALASLNELIEFRPIPYFISFFGSIYILLQILYPERMKYRFFLLINRVTRKQDGNARRLMRISIGVFVFGIILMGIAYPLLRYDAVEYLVKAALIGGLVICNIGIVIFLTSVVNLLGVFTKHWHRWKDWSDE